MRSWYNWIVAALFGAAVADVFFGLNAVLHALSMVAAIGLAAVTVLSAAIAISILGMIVVRDAVHEIATDRQQGRPWRWRYIGWIGIIGMLVDGAVGAWHAYQEHILFSAAVAQIPFAGVPVFVALGSYPLKWIEALLMKRLEHPTSKAPAG